MLPGVGRPMSSLSVGHTRFCSLFSSLLRVLGPNSGLKQQTTRSPLRERERESERGRERARVRERLWRGGGWGAGWLRESQSESNLHEETCHVISLESGPVWTALVRVGRLKEKEQKYCSITSASCLFYYECKPFLFSCNQPSCQQQQQCDGQSILQYCVCEIQFSLFNIEFSSNATIQSIWFAQYPLHWWTHI